MRGARILARWCIAIALLIGGTNAGLAQSSVDCSSGPGALQTAINALTTANQTLTITGTCTPAVSPGFFVIGNAVATPVTLLAGVDGATIMGQIQIGVSRVTLSGLTIDGTGVTPDATILNGGIDVTPGVSVTIDDCTIQNWSVNGVVVARSTVAINGGTITGNTLAGIDAIDGSAVLGGLFSFEPVTVSANGTGINVEAGGNVRMYNGSVENNINDGVDVTDRSSIVFETNGGAGTSITGNGGEGILVDQGSNLTLGSGNVSTNAGGGITVENGSNASIGANITGGTPATLTQITGNGSSGSNHAGSGVGAITSSIAIDGATISGNMNGGNLKGAAVTTIGSTASIKNSSISSFSGLAGISSFGSTLTLQKITLTGPGNASALSAAGGSHMYLIASTVADNDAHDATVLLGDGSALESLGGNTICAGTFSGLSCTAITGGTAITAANASTFHQVFGALNQNTQFADTITGSATVQMQSNMELGTGAATPSSWTGSISVAQNSSFRMDGGMDITGGVTLGQGSNGFFNKAAGGTNTVSAGVTCPGSTSHVVGPAAVVISGTTPAATLVTTGPGCYGF